MSPNALAAAAAARGLGMPWRARSPTGCATFAGDFEQNPGRFNVTDAPGFTTIVDYAHNPAAMRALWAGRVTAMRTPGGRTIGVVSTPGDRRDEDIREIGRIAAGIFDELVFRELPDGRGRAPGGVLALLEEGARAPAPTTRPHPDRPRRGGRDGRGAATRRARRRRRVMPTDVDGVWRRVQRLRLPERVDV